MRFRTHRFSHREKQQKKAPTNFFGRLQRVREDTNNISKNMSDLISGCTTIKRGEVNPPEPLSRKSRKARLD